MLTALRTLSANNCEGSNRTVESVWKKNEWLRLTVLDILVDLRCVVGRISFLDCLHGLGYGDSQVQRPYWCACLGQAYRSSSRGSIFVVVHFLHQPFLRGLQWPKPWPLHRVVVTSLTRRGGVHGVFERRLRVTASDHCEPTRLVAIVQQRSWETGEVQRVSRLPRAQISVNEPKGRYSKAIRVYLSLIELQLWYKEGRQTLCFSGRGHHAQSCPRAKRNYHQPRASSPSNPSN